MAYRGSIESKVRAPVTPSEVQGLLHDRPAVRLLSDQTWLRSGRCYARAQGAGHGSNHQTTASTAAPTIGRAMRSPLYLDTFSAGTNRQSTRTRTTTPTRARGTSDWRRQEQKRLIMATPNGWAGVASPGRGARFGGTAYVVLSGPPLVQSRHVLGNFVSRRWRRPPGVVAGPSRSR